MGPFISICEVPWIRNATARYKYAICHCEETPQGSTWQSGHLSYPCTCSGCNLPGEPFLRRIPGTESSRLVHFAVKLARFNRAGGIPPRLFGNGGKVCGIASSPSLRGDPAGPWEVAFAISHTLGLGNRIATSVRPSACLLAMTEKGGRPLPPRQGVPPSPVVPE